MCTPGLKRLAIAVLGVSLLWAVQSFAQSLKQVGVIDLPGPKGQRFDYLTMDDEDHYLLSAHLGPGILYVIDVRTNALVKAISGVPGITGVEYIPTLHKVWCATASGECRTRADRSCSLQTQGGSDCDLSCPRSSSHSRMVARRFERLFSSPVFSFPSNISIIAAS
jgi:hypothetical protein